MSKTNSNALTRIIDTGTTVAFLTPEYAWVQGTVVAYDIKSKTYTCTSRDPVMITIDRIPATLDALWAPGIECFDEDKNDLLELTELHEASLLFCLKRRYLRDCVYTNIGPIVVALNPFNFHIPWYQDTVMKNYLAEGVVIENNLPHSWAVAHNTYWEMRENKQNQTILISGESGAGKTEAAKIVARYLGAVSTLSGTEEQREAMTAVNKKILAASPILESFGNAKTVRNDNSSRFGKFAKMQFDATGFLVGCHTTKYLLEKSRIITAAQNERVYHSFYQLAQGELAKKFGIRNVLIYRTLRSGSCTSIEGVDDAADFVVTHQSMKDIGITEEEQDGVWRTVAGILYLQNVEFTETEEQSGRVARVDAALQTAVTRTCELWEIAEGQFTKELTSTTMVTRNEETVKLLNLVQSQDTRDAVSKSVYDWLFNWLVEKINQTTDVERRCVQWIGLLDIFGFEDFTVNSFEQLCINLANETLQNHYNRHIFTEDMKECKAEGIDTASVTFADNQGCIDLLIGKPGVFSLIDEECQRSGTEKNLLSVLNEKYATTKQHAGNPYYVQATGKSRDNHFRIRHYAAEVGYCIDSFLDKNRETLKDSMKLVLKKANLAFLSSITPAVEEATSRPTAKLSVGGYFIRQLAELMEVINSTHPHWIRCVKPDPSKQPRMFNHLTVMSQLRSAGVLDTVKVRKAGYPIRFPFDVFVKRYRVLFPASTYEALSIRERIVKLFQAFDITVSIGQIGKTKVFLRQEAFLKFNHSKMDALKDVALLLQAVGSGSKVREGLFREYVQLHRARLLEAKRLREEAIRRQEEEEARRKREEAEELERRERLAKQRKFVAAVTIQRHVRGHLARRAVVRLFIEMHRAADECACDSELQKFRNQFANVDRRVRSIEERHLEKMKSRGGPANEETDDRRDRMRQRWAEVQKKRQDAADAVLKQRARDLKSDGDRKRETVKQRQDQYHSALQARIEARDQQRAQQEAAEERRLQQLREVQRREKALQEARHRLESSIYHNDESVPSVAAAEVQFDAARSHFVAMEYWACAREDRLRATGSSLTADERHLEQAYRGLLLSQAARRLEQRPLS